MGIDGGELQRMTILELAELQFAVAREMASRAVPASGHACLEMAEEAVRTLDIVQARVAALVARVDATCTYKSVGRQSSKAWLCARTGMTEYRAGELVRVGRRLTRMPRVSGLLLAGKLPWGYASVIADACDLVPDGEDLDAVQDILLRAAGKGVTPKRIKTELVAFIKSVVDDHLGRPPGDEKRGYKRSWLRLAKSTDGTYVNGFLTPEDAAAVTAAIAPALKANVPEDTRDHAEKTADALISSIVKGKGANVTLVIDSASWLFNTGSMAPFNTPANEAPRTTGTLTAISAIPIPGQPISTRQAGVQVRGAPPRGAPRISPTPGNHSSTDPCLEGPGAGRPAGPGQKIGRAHV